MARRTRTDSSSPSSRSSGSRRAKKTRRCAHAPRFAPSCFTCAALALTRLSARFLPRLKYIETELAKRRGTAGGAGGGGEAPGDANALALASLYETPEELRAASPGGADGDEDGADRWLTGIVEVQLPVEYKLQVPHNRTLALPPDVANRA
jgi:hypothetical protein